MIVVLCPEADSSPKNQAHPLKHLNGQHSTAEIILNAFNELKSTCLKKHKQQLHRIASQKQSHQPKHRATVPSVGQKSDFLSTVVNKLCKLVVFSACCVAQDPLQHVISPNCTRESVMDKHRCQH